jgi:hypothetical protein
MRDGNNIRGMIVYTDADRLTTVRPESIIVCTHATRSDMPYGRAHKR